VDERCESISGALGRVVDGEASPAESFRVARHLPGCTGCRILLARERRLAAALDGLVGPDANDPDLLERVMASLGKRPVPKPVTPGKRLARRGLRLAALLTAIPALEWAAQAAEGWRWTAPAWASASPAAETIAGRLGALAASAAATFAAAGDIGPVPALGISLTGLLAGAASSLAIAGGGLATVLALVLATGVRQRVP
jgi:hypothetical protein